MPLFEEGIRCDYSVRGVSVLLHFLRFSNSGNVRHAELCIHFSSSKSGYKYETAPFQYPPRNSVLRDEMTVKTLLACKIMYSQLELNNATHDVSKLQ